MKINLPEKVRTMVKNKENKKFNYLPYLRPIWETWSCWRVGYTFSLNYLKDHGIHITCGMILHMPL